MNEDEEILEESDNSDIDDDIIEDDINEENNDDIPKEEIIDDEQEEDIDNDDNFEDDDDDEFNDDFDSQKLSENIKQDEDINIFKLTDNLEIDDSDEFLQKFNTDVKNNYILENHHECLNKSFEEIKILSKVTRNKQNIIIDNFHKTIPILTKYEKTKILGLRVKQLNNNSKPYISVNENIIDNYIIANKELEEKKLPFIIQRPIPNNTFEYWKLQDLEII
jgi:DNA-directed RNA polymerase subunit K/omega